LVPCNEQRRKFEFLNKSFSAQSGIIWGYFFIFLKLNRIMKGIEVFGNNLTEEEKGKAESQIYSNRKEVQAYYEGEYEKTEEDFAIISDLNSYLQEELKEIGIEDMQPILAGQIHIFPEPTFKKYYPDAGTYIFYKPLDNSISFNGDIVDQVGRLYLFESILHEMVHAASISKFYLQNETISVYRSGYRSMNPTKEHEHLNGLNEAVVEKMAIEIFKKHKRDIIVKFGINADELQKDAEYTSHYIKYIEILDIILKRIADVNGENLEEVWNRFKKGLFSGEMMHLRDIKKICGKESFEMIDLLESEEMAENQWEIIEKVKKYFEEKK